MLQRQTPVQGSAARIYAWHGMAQFRRQHRPIELELFISIGPFIQPITPKLLAWCATELTDRALRFLPPRKKNASTELRPPEEIDDERDGVEESYVCGADDEFWRRICQVVSLRVRRSRPFPGSAHEAVPLPNMLPSPGSSRPELPPGFRCCEFPF
ncbi:hypothetical protein BHM03_00042758 [Ensete ventricosum]|nr:hypothetical protein BHM03_00042758 [Ensete ventricosum]